MRTDAEVAEIRARFDAEVAKYRPSFVGHVVKGGTVICSASGIVGGQDAGKEYAISMRVDSDDSLDEKLTYVIFLADEGFADLGVDGFDPPQKTPQTVGED
jgi:hypothetical protein